MGEPVVGLQRVRAFEWFADGAAWGAQVAAGGMAAIVGLASVWTRDPVTGFAGGPN